MEEALQAVGDLLADENERFAIVVIGGAALQLLGIVRRTTHDVDVVAFGHATAPPTRLIRPPNPLPAPLVRAVRAVARDRDLGEDWLNGGPGGQWDNPSPLPPGFESRVHWQSFGGLEVGIADRFDLVHFKLEAAADHPTSANRHFRDLLALSPTPPELRTAANWVRENNADNGYYASVERVITLIAQAAHQDPT